MKEYEVKLWLTVQAENKAEAASLAEQACDYAERGLVGSAPGDVSVATEGDPELTDAHL